MLLSKYKRKPEAWNKHVVLYLESEATSLSANTSHPFRLIPWLLELDPANNEVCLSLCSLTDLEASILFLIISFWLHRVFVAVLRLSLVAVSGGYSLVVGLGLSLWWLLLLPSMGSVTVACGLSCSVACGIFLDQRSNLHPLNWQADS